MQVSRWGNSLAVRLPKALVDQLGLKPGDEVEVVAAHAGLLQIAKDVRRSEALERLRALKVDLPAGYAFDRDDANRRQD